MTEVPEHLLRRSRERKAALGGEAPPAGAEGEADAGSAGSAGAAGAGSAVEPAAPARVATAAPAPPTYTGPPQPPPRKQRVPVWAMPVLAALPFWALLYTGSFGDRPTKGPAGPVEVGQGVFRQAGCAGCHGPTGGGGAGPPLANVVKTFPTFEDHVAWVTNGSAAVKGQTYGNSGRVATGNMPGFGKQLSAAEIVAVVCHERVDYGKEEPVPKQCEAGAEAGAEADTAAGH